MKKCLEACKELNTACPVVECKYWIDYPQETNCVFEAVSSNGAMTLREVSERIGVSYVRVKQIQDKALKKIGLLLKDEAI